MSFKIDISDTIEQTPAVDALSLQGYLHPLVSVIVPTYKEAENLPILIPRVCKALDRSGMTFEILVVDDNSPDATPAVCEQLRQQFPVRLLIRTEERGLSSAVIHGMQQARGSVLLVMDADLSHPPEKVPELVAAVLEGQGEFVIGSRYVPGGTTDDAWSFFRWLNSQVATVMSRGLTAAKDPMAGFFAMARQTFEQAQQLNPIGYKIGLELIVKCNCQNVAEVPIHFSDRLHGESKLSLKEQLNYLRHLGRLYRFKLGQWGTPLLFGAVGASGVVIDLLLLSLFMLISSFPIARAVAIWGAMSWNYLGNRRFTFADRKREHFGLQYLMFCSSCLLGAFVSWGISTLVWQKLSVLTWGPQLSALAGILGGFALNYLLSNHFVFRKSEPDLSAFLGEKPKRCRGERSEQFGLENPEPSKKNGLFNRATLLGLMLVIAFSLALSSPTWFRQEIDGLDQAHNVLTSLFFFDAYRDLPVERAVSYTFEYQRQYPALGLVFWPPLFHALAGAAMLVLGPELQTVHLILAGFSLLLGVAMYLALTPRNSPLAAVMAVGVALTTPVLFELQNTVMLEVPSLAMVFVVLMLYVRVTARERWLNTGEALLAGTCCALVAYTKQPAVFVLLGIFLDVVFHHRHLLKERLTWVCVSTTGLLLLPLAAFTWKFGQVNLAQSIGNQGNIYVEHHRVAERWSVEGWTYYLQLLPEQLPWLVLLLSAVGMVIAMSSPQQRREHGIWLWCAVAWYLMFSYFDNKQVRFVAYVLPFLSVAAVLAAQTLLSQRRVLGYASLVVLIAGFGWNMQTVAQTPPCGYKEVARIVQDCLQGEAEGNLVYFGEDHHLFTAQLRLLDDHRQRALLRGDDVLELAEGNLPLGLHKFRARWLLIDPELPIGQETLTQLAALPEEFEQVTDAMTLDNGRKPIQVMVYRYRGSLAEQMQSIPLKSQKLGL